MSNEEAINLIIRNADVFRFDEEMKQALTLAIIALNHEVYWEDVKEALNGWLNNTTSTNTALNDIYRAYMGRGDKAVTNDL